MKSTFIILISILVITSCKKYSEDSFISSYTPEGRIKNTTSNVWSLNKYFDEFGNEKNIDSFNLKLNFNADSVYISSLNDEFSSVYKWEFESKKKFLEINSFWNFEILQLEVDKMKLKNEKGQLFIFNKVKKEEFVYLSDESFLNIPSFGLLAGENKSLKLIGINQCEENNINVVANGSLNSALVTGLFGNGFGFNGAPNTMDYNFSKFFSKEGYITFYTKMNAYTNYNLSIKINGIQTSFDEVNEITLENNVIWRLIRVRVPSGNVNVNLISNKLNSSGGTVTSYAINAIDEIKFWEIE